MSDRPIRTRTAWRVLRAAWDLADGEWTWKGSYEHFVQIARVPRERVGAHLRELAAEKALTVVLQPQLGRATISWPPASRAELVRLLHRIGPGEHRFPHPSEQRCSEPDCELAVGEDGTHPLLRPGEVMRWESPAQLVSVPIEAPPVAASDDLAVGERLVMEIFAIRGAR